MKAYKGFQYLYKGLLAITIMVISQQHRDESRTRYNKEYSELSRGQRMIITKVINGTLKGGKRNPQHKNYNVKHKNSFRSQVVNSFKAVGNPGDIILCLETSQYLFVKEQGRNYNYIVYERDIKEFKRMMINKPNGLLLCRGDIGEYGLVMGADKPRFAFLDFCGTLNTLTDSIKRLSNVLSFCDKVAFTFAIRGHKSMVEGHKGYLFDILLNLSRLLPSHTLEHSPTVYKDGAAMIGLIFKRVITV